MKALTDLTNKAKESTNRLVLILENIDQVNAEHFDKIITDLKTQLSTNVDELTKELNYHKSKCDKLIAANTILTAENEKLTSDNAAYEDMMQKTKSVMEALTREVKD